MTRIEPLSLSHATGLFQALSDTRSYTYLDTGPPASTRALRTRIVHLLAGPQDDSGEIWLNWSVFCDDAIVGYTQVTIHSDGRAVLAYLLHPDAWGRSIAQDACLRTLAVLRARPDVRRIVADTDCDNHRSQTLLGRLGFVKTQTRGRDIHYELAAPPPNAPSDKVMPGQTGRPGT
jgi:RimJ/RimL family protein N-acetyltransferase